MRGWVLVIVVAACGPGATGPRGSARATKCIDRGVAETEEAAARDRNRAALLAALAARDLTLVAIEPVVEDTREDITAWRERDGYALAPVSYRSCGQLPAYELASDQEGGLWAILPAPNQTGTRELHACGCMADDPVTCGGAAPEPVLLAYPVPPGLTFRGPVEVPYPHEVVSVFLVGRADGSECPPLPPPPP